MKGSEVLFFFPYVFVVCSSYLQYKNSLFCVFLCSKPSQLQAISLLLLLYISVQGMQQCTHHYIEYMMNAQRVGLVLQSIKISNC